MGKTRVEVRESRKDRYWTVSIDPFFEPENPKYFFKSKVSVSCSQQMGDLVGDVWTYYWSKAAVSWSSLGEVSAEEASAFAEALRIAVEWAKRMDAEEKKLVPR